MAELLGELHQFAARLGSPPSFSTLRGLDLWLPAVASPARDSAWPSLEKYKERLLLGFELPAVARAFCYASRYELRELIALDQQLTVDIPLKRFALTSQRVGRLQLKRLRPLKDQRLVQRYLAAIQANQARGWHMLVYGLTLAIYSLPLRQGLLNYARHTLHGLVLSVSPGLPPANPGPDRVLEDICRDLPQGVERVLASQLDAKLRLA